MGMSDKEFRAKMQRMASTPSSRAKDWFTIWLARIGGCVLLIWLVTYLSNK